MAFAEHRRRHTGPCRTGEEASADAGALHGASPSQQLRRTSGRSTSRGGSAPRIDPLTTQDAASRYLLVCAGNARAALRRRVLERAFREYGLPRVIRTDNGPPFAGVGLGSLSPLSAWWVKLGILPERIEPGHPERTVASNGSTGPSRRRLPRHRRPLRGASRSMAVQLQQREAPRADTPGHSLHAIGGRIRSTGIRSRGLVRRVRGNGQIKWKGELVYLSDSLRGEPVGLVQQNERTWSIQFGPLLIGVLDDPTRRVDKTPTKVLPMSPV